MKIYRVLPIGLVFAGAALMAGCGSGGSSLGARTSGGSLAMTLRWPPRIARAIPSGTQSVRVIVRGSTESQIGQPTIVNRPSSPSPGPARVVIDKLQPGPIFVEVTAHGLSDAGGPPISFGSGQGTIVDGQRAVIPVDMASTVVSIVGLPTSLSLAVNERTGLQPVAQDGAQQALTGIGFEFIATNPGVASVDPRTGDVVGLTQGQTDIIVREEGSGGGGDTQSPLGPTSIVTVFVR